MRKILFHKRPWKKEKDYAKKILLYDKDIKGRIGQIQVVKVGAGSTVAPHYHKIQREIFYILKGGAKIVIGEKEMRCHPGEVIILEPREVHQVINDTKKDFELLVFKINPKEKDKYFI